MISADLYPTLLSLCGLDPRPEQHVDGVDVSGVIACDELADRALHWHFPHYSHGGSTPASAIRRGSWKLTRDYETGRTVLCDLAVDPGEEGDLSADHPDVVTELDELLDRWLDDVEGRVPRPNRAPFDEYAR